MWANQARAIRHYWTIYGGVKALVLSPYLHIAATLTVVTTYFKAGNKSASDLAVSVLPNLLGFTVGALAIVLAFSSASVFRTLAERGNPHSFFMKLTSSLIHFILVQVIALVTSIIASITGGVTIDTISLFFLFYAVLVTFAAGIQLFLSAIISNTKAELDAQEQSGTNPG